jgi:hypothetical protein
MIIIKRRTFFNFVIIFVVIVAICFGVLFYFKLNKTKLQDTAKENEVASLISKVSRLYLFPEGETPTIATVSDPQLLKGQAFFTQSEKGDNVLIFLKAGKAVLYRPSIDKIIEIAPIKNNLPQNN